MRSVRTGPRYGEAEEVVRARESSHGKLVSSASEKRERDKSELLIREGRGGGGRGGLMQRALKLRYELRVSCVTSCV